MLQEAGAEYPCQHLLILYSSALFIKAVPSVTYLANAYSESPLRTIAVLSKRLLPSPDTNWSLGFQLRNIVVGYLYTV